MENISNTSDQTISLMTMHAAKGLEFDFIFLAGWEEGYFPAKDLLKKLVREGLKKREDWLTWLLQELEKKFILHM